jgi:Ni/Fe-hydrogenase subunit HybB-like protein
MSSDIIRSEIEKQLPPGPPDLQYREVDAWVLRGLLRPSKPYLLLLGFSLTCLLAGLIALLFLIFVSIGLAGIRNPVNWGVFIISFVFWVGIAHSGTLISAILYLFRTEWRTSINRIAEAMTVSSVAVAGLFPLVHLGRIWYFYWLIPYPNYREIWPNFRSALIWDLTAVLTYMTVSIVFFYTGLIPDIATVRDRSAGIRRRIYGALALGWRGSNRQWHHFEMALLLLSGLATALVVSVSSVVSWDFSSTIVPAWHDEIFAPEFVTGALFSGFAMIIVILVPLRKLAKLEHLITLQHFNMICKMLIALSLLLSYMYASEFFSAYYSGDMFERHTFTNWAIGLYPWEFWLMIVFNSILPLTLFYVPLRSKLPYLFVISVLAIIGMWLERFVIIVSSLSQGYNPYAWGRYAPTITEIGIFAGSVGLFFFIVAFLGKVFPVVAIGEVKRLIRSITEEASHAK